MAGAAARRWSSTVARAGSQSQQFFSPVNYDFMLRPVAGRQPQPNRAFLAYMFDAMEGRPTVGSSVSVRGRAATIVTDKGWVPNKVHLEDFAPYKVKYEDGSMSGWLLRGDVVAVEDTRLTMGNKVSVGGRVGTIVTNKGSYKVKYEDGTVSGWLSSGDVVAVEAA